MEAASTTEISFIGNKKYEKLWESSKACAAIVNEDIAIEPGENKAFIKVKYICYSFILKCIFIFVFKYRDVLFLTGCQIQK